MDTDPGPLVGPRLAHPRPVRPPVGERRRARARRRDRDGPARGTRTSRCSATATRSSPGRTSAGPSRVVIAGHIDTVPIADNLPTRLVGEGAQAELWGRGTVDMKAGVAVQLALAAELTRADARRHVGVLRPRGGRRRRSTAWAGSCGSTRTGWRATSRSWASRRTAGIEGGCNGTLRAEVRLAGVAAHSARAWMGRNAIHAAGEVLRRLEAYTPARGRGRRAGLPGEPQRGARLGRHGGERHPGRLRRHGELPVRAVGERRAGVGPRARAVRRVRRRDRRRRTRCAARAGRPGRAGVRAGRAGDHGRCARGQVRLDRRRPVLRARACPP